MIRVCTVIGRYGIRAARALLPPAVIAMTVLAPPSHAANLGEGPLPIRVVPPAASVAEGAREIRIEGQVAGPGTALVILRIDDARSGDYASRFNEERTLPPGPFRWTIGLRGLRTPNGRDLELEALRRIHLFSDAGVRVTVGRFEIVDAPRLPDGAAGYSFGHPRAPVPWGFRRIAPGDPVIEAGRALPVRRPAPDPLVANGMRALERVRLPAPAGKVRLTLWLEDPGEWSDLAHPLQREIKVNGRLLTRWQATPAEWIASRYMRHREREHDAADDAWTAYGRWRGERVSIEVDATADGVLIELHGGTAEELFVAAALVEQADGGDAAALVEFWRAEWYRSNWPIGMAHDDPAPVTFAPSGPARTLVGVAAPGSGVRLQFAIAADRNVASPDIVVEAPRLAGDRLGLRVWAAQRRLDRRGAGDTILTLSDNMLRGDAAALALVAGRPRTYDAWIDVPRKARPGTYEGEVSIKDHSGLVAHVPMRVEVLDAVLPAAAKPAGYYLDEAPHLTWFKETQADRPIQLACDLALLRSLGIDGDAPALSTPGGNGAAFVADMRLAHDHATVAPWLAYAPAKRLRDTSGIAGSAATLARLTETLAAEGLPSPVWSIADEPSNPGHADKGLREWIAAIRTRAPKARIAAHLNAAGDIAMAPLFDVVLVNDGFGLDRGRLQGLAGQSEVWAYNTSLPRLTAGLWLWSMPAVRYLQWHARMPTADPFDPTDGREGDVQMIYPAPRTCPNVPDIHRHLLFLAEGIVDQRWLVWLDAQQGTDAEAVKRRIRASLPDAWSEARRIADPALQAMRDSIMALARRAQ